MLLKPIHPNAGLAVVYRERILAIVEEMHRSYFWWIRAKYRANPPRMAQDASPAKTLEEQLEDLGAQWERRFEDMAPKLANYFAQAVSQRSSKMLAKILWDGGISVKFRMTPVMRDVVDATVAENVALIRSVPQQYHAQVQGLVMRSVTAGRDLSELSRQLQKEFGVTKRRAALIARDQNNKATAVFTRVRQIEVGITEAIWLHSAAGKKPRKTHVANTGKRYNVAEGWFDPDPKVRQRIWPGMLINCRCTSRAIVAGFS